MERDKKVELPDSLFERYIEEINKAHERACVNRFLFTGERVIRFRSNVSAKWSGSPNEIEV